MVPKSQPSGNYSSVDLPSSPSSDSYYSAPSSPTPTPTIFSLGNESDVQKDDNLDSNLDGFEFETSKRWRYEEVELEKRPSFGSPLEDKHKEQPRGRSPRGASLPTMAFADELFSNGLVLPLKPPPWLRCEGGYLSSTASSPRSPSTVLKIQYSRQCKWDDEFDPFMVALEKVRDETRGINDASEVQSRRTRSLSPFREKVLRWPENHDNELGKPMNSASARWFCSGFKENEPKKKMAREIAIPNGNDSIFGRKGRSADAGLEGEIINHEENQRKTKKSFVSKHVLFGRKKSEVKIKEQIVAFWKKTSLGRLSFKLK